MNDLCNLTISSAAELIRTGKLSPVDLTKAYLDRTASLDASLNAFILVTRDQALRDASEAHSEITAGRYRGPLHGIPLAVKDVFDVSGLPTTAHSDQLRDNIASSDSTAVARLRAAGMIILGKTSTWEFAIGGPSFDLPWPPARNPWKLSHDPAGSSSGSASAVAAGLAPAALGTDTAGSIRSPSAWAGLAGLKPTYGLVSRKGIFPLSYTMDHAGPMCWTVEDCALMMQALAGHDPADPGSAHVDAIDFTGRLSDGVDGLRIGIVRHFFEQDEPADADVLAATERAINALREGGASVVDVELSSLETYYDVAGLVMHSEAYAIHQSMLIKTPLKYGALARQRLAIGAFIGAGDYVNGLRMRARLVEQAAAVMTNVDLLVTPTRNSRALPIGHFDMQTGKHIYTRPFSVLGLPALSLCAGISEDGLPLGLQIVGRPFEDDLVLRAGHFVEATLSLRHRRPELLIAS